MWQVALWAVRPKTLWLSLGPVLLASTLAWRTHRFELAVASAALLGAVALQIGTNLFNDWADAKSGADDAERLGPLRVTASELVAPRTVVGFALGAFVVAIGCGLCLLARAPAWVLGVGTSGLLCGWAYTCGPRPLAHAGLGELFAFLYFGPLATATTYRLHTGEQSAASWSLGVALGAFAAAVLAINNLRDVQSDARVGKNTLAVRLGERATRFFVATCLCLPTAIVLAVALADRAVRPVAWGIIAAPLAWRLAWRLRPGANPVRGRRLNAALAQAALAQWAFALSIALGLWLF